MCRRTPTSENIHVHIMQEGTHQHMTEGCIVVHTLVTGPQVFALDMMTKQLISPDNEILGEGLRTISGS